MIDKVFPKIHNEGYKFLVIFGLGTLVLYLISGFLGLIGIILTIWVYYFFRDPDRFPINDENYLVSPADGLVIKVEEVNGPSELSLENKKFTFAGKTGSSQIKRFTEAQREAEVKQENLDYKDRDHALFIAYAPVSDPKYAISVVVEHGGSGSKAAAPIAKKVIKKVLERHDLRQSTNNLLGEPI